MKRILGMSGAHTPGIETGLILGLQASGGMIEAGGKTMVGLRPIGVHRTGHGMNMAGLRSVPLGAR